ncbi:glycosyltransferase [candidate division KSB1 bacterium]|nr:glycosyltransferase [candidate division KSB1 bacterium]
MTTQNTTKDISAIVTFRNMEGYVEDYYRTLKSTMDDLGKNYELIFVDDASDDRTYQSLEKITTSDERVRLIKMRSQFGEASAFEAGFNTAQGEKIIFYTTRVRPNAEHLPRLLKKLDEGNDLVIGWRYPRRDSVLNRIISRIFNGVATKLSDTKLHDINSGIFVTRRDVLEHIQIYGGLSQFIPILAKRQGYKIAEEKIEQLKGKFRQSRFVGEYVQRSMDILTVLFLTKYSKKPIHFLGLFGGSFLVVGIFINFYLFLYRIFGFGPIAGRPLLLLGALCLVIGIQMVAMGLIGEMIIFTHAGDIKEYNIEKILDNK